MPHMQWQGKTINVSTNQVLWIDYSNIYDIIGDNLKKIKTEIKKSIEGNYKDVIERSATEMNDKEKRLVDISTLTGVWSLDTEFGFELSKQQFWDSVRLRYDWEISNLPTSCPCDSKFDIQHSMSCKNGCFIYIRHNDLRRLTANMMSEVCNCTKIEPKLIP